MDKFISRKRIYINPKSKMTPIKKIIDFFGYRFFCKNMVDLDYLDLNSIKSVCIVQMGHIGDFLLSTPMVSAIREKFNGKLILAINKNTFELASNLKGIDEVIVLEHPRRIYSRSKDNSFFSAAKTFSKIDADVVLEVRGDINIIPFISMFSKYKYLIGFDVGGAGFLLDKALEYPHGGHITETYDKFLDFFKINVPKISKLDKYYELNVSNPIENDKYIVVAVGRTGARSKDWEIGNFIKLINMFLDNNYTVVLVGKLAHEESREYDKLSNKSLINLINKTTLISLLSILRDAYLFVGLDSGSTHAAAMLGVRTIALYSGVVDFNVFRPIEIFGNVSIVKSNVDCEKCYKINCENNICMKMISPEMVFSRSVELINKGISNE